MNGSIRLGSLLYLVLEISIIKKKKIYLCIEKLEEVLNESLKGKRKIYRSIVCTHT